MANCRHGIEETTCADCLLKAKLKTAVRLRKPVDTSRFIVDRSQDGDGNNSDDHRKERDAFYSTVKTEKQILDEEKIEDVPEDVEEASEKIAEEEGIKEQIAEILPVNEVSTEPINLPPLLTSEERFRKRQLTGLPKGMEFQVPVSRIKPMPNQPREFFDPVKLQELAESIRLHGQQKAVDVRWLPNDPSWYCELIDGERRLKVAKDLLKLPTLRVIVREVADYKQQLLISAIANFGREGHTPLEIANMIDRLLKLGFKPPEVAAVFGKSLSWIYNHQKLAWLDPKVKVLLDPSLPWEKGLRLLTASMLVTLPADLQIELAQKVIEEGMSVNTARQYIRRRAKEAGFIAGDPNRTPVEDYNNLRSSLKLMDGRLILLLDTPIHELRSMFEHREPADLLKVLEEAKDLHDKTRTLCDKIKYLKSEPAQQASLF